MRQINFQAFQRRDVLGQNVTGDTRRLLRRSDERVLESPRAMLQRVLRGMPALTGRGGKISSMLNDEAHHCYCRPPSCRPPTRIRHAVEEDETELAAPVRQ